MDVWIQDGFKVSDVEIQFYGGRLDGKKVCGLRAVKLLAKGLSHRGYDIVPDGVIIRETGYFRAVPAPSA